MQLNLPSRSEDPAPSSATNNSDDDRLSSPRAAPREEDVRLAFLAAAAAPTLTLLGERERQFEFDLLLRASRRFHEEVEAIAAAASPSAAAPIGGAAGGSGSAAANSTATSAAGSATGGVGSLISASSFFGLPSRFDSSNNETAAKGSTAPATSSSPSTRQDFIYTIFLVGNSGSGKTTFKQCCTQSFLKTLPEVRPSIMSASNAFYFTSSKKDKLEIQVVDAGPHPSSRAASSHFLFQGDSLYLLHMSLAGVMQLSKKAGNTILFHDNDKNALRGHIASIVAGTGGRGASLAVIGTHMDQLSDSSKGAVERVLQVINEFVSAEIEGLRATGASPLRLVGCFAISCVDHTCVSENRGGPKSIRGLWEFFCDLSAKEARLSHARLVKKWGDDYLGKNTSLISVAAAAAAVPITTSNSNNNNGSNALISNNSIAIPGSNASSLAHFGAEANASITSGNGTAAVDAALLGSNSRSGSKSMASMSASHNPIMRMRLIGLLRKAKSELGAVLISEHAVAQVAYSLGNCSKALLRSVVQQLEMQCELRVFEHVSPSVSGQRQLLLVPHLITKATFYLHTFAATAGYPRPDRQKMLPGVVVEECEAADPRRHCASRGVIVPKLLIALSKCLSTIHKEADARSELFATMLVIGNIALQIIEPDTSEVDIDSLDVGAHPPSGLLYVVPSLVGHWGRQHGFATLRQHVTAHRIPFVHFDLYMRPAPACFFPQLVCRLAAYLATVRSVLANGVWLTSNEELASRGWIQLQPRDANGSAATHRDQHCETGEATLSILCCSPASMQLASCFALEVIGIVKRLLQSKFAGCVWHFERVIADGDPDFSHRGGRALDAVSRALSELDVLYTKEIR